MKNSSNVESVRVSQEEFRKNLKSYLEISSSGTPVEVVGPHGRVISVLVTPRDPLPKD